MYSKRLLEKRSIPDSYRVAVSTTPSETPIRKGARVNVTFHLLRTNKPVTLADQPPPPGISNDMAESFDESSDVGLSTQGLSIVHGSICVMSLDRLTWCEPKCIIMKLQ